MPERKLSGYEKYVGREIDPWTRGMHFTWIYEDLDLKWHGYEQFWFFRGSRDWYLVYIPFFWRDRAEFKMFEKKFIRLATEPKGRISEREFIRQAENFKANLNLGMIQAPLLAAVSGTVGGAAGTVATALEKTSSALDAIEVAKCMNGDDQACLKMVQIFAFRRYKKAVAR